ncbi:pyrimidine 5'-nucleotidase [Pikeienuella piscinae]|uniref:Pyrimidine 5'-nucleotidase n=1 Tax=Pikeienuella piscinae TaxID=2748098 RepID=A0A7L5BVJ4_9RHOB|nr:pyrimidine 5'-nucleotidase [Pikeienuella piscinae]QIE55113.1 pyrimidine 5'-nucleotidase [Pikeienuella piscinae]
MPHALFRTAHAWVFDLDNTLYPPSAKLFDQIVAKMTAYVMRTANVDAAEAERLREVYWREYGTTLAGLMQVHGVDPAPFLDDVHDIDLSALERDKDLGAAIAALPGRKIVYTNGSRLHADRVLAARGLDGLFDARYGVEDAGYAPKPQRAAFERVFAADRLNAKGAAMVEDDLRNLAAPREMGMRTLWITEKTEAHEHADATTGDLAGFLKMVLER